MPLKTFKTILIQPAPGVLGETLTANQRLIDIRIAHGAQKAEEALEELLVPA